MESSESISKRSDRYDVAKALNKRASFIHEGKAWTRMQDLRRATRHRLEFELRQQRHQNIVSKTETCIPAEQALYVVTIL